MTGGSATSSAFLVACHLAIHGAARHRSGRFHVANLSTAQYDRGMSRKFAIYEPPKKAGLPHLVAVIKNGKLKDAFAVQDLEEAEILLRKMKARAEGRGD